MLDLTDTDPYPPQGLALLYFTASWCAPCRALRPVIEDAERATQRWQKIIERHGAKTRQALAFRRVDIDHVRGLATRFDVRSVPTCLVIRDGRLIGTPLVGAAPKAKFHEWLSRLLEEPLRRYP